MTAAMAKGITLLVLAFVLVAGVKAQDHDAITAARFELSIDGASMASFDQLEFLSLSVEAGEQPRTVCAVQLRRGYSRNPDLWNWFQNSAAGATRANASLVFYARNGRQVARYNLTQAWPSKIQIGIGDSGEMLVETVTIVCEHIQRVSQ